MLPTCPITRLARRYTVCRVSLCLQRSHASVHAASTSCEVVCAVTSTLHTRRFAQLYPSFPSSLLPLSPSLPPSLLTPLYMYLPPPYAPLSPSSLFSPTPPPPPPCPLPQTNLPKALRLIPDPPPQSPLHHQINILSLVVIIDPDLGATRLQILLSYLNHRMKSAS